MESIYATLIYVCPLCIYMDSILYLDNSLALMNVNMNYNMHANNPMAMISMPDQIN
jgi:hypothetical protein